MSTFAAAFKEIVFPDIAELVDLLAPRVACGLTGFDTACCDVLQFALRRGAARLPQSVFYDLEDWIATRMLCEAAAVEERRSA